MFQSLVWTRWQCIASSVSLCRHLSLSQRTAPILCARRYPNFKVWIQLWRVRRGVSESTGYTCGSSITERFNGSSLQVCVIWISRMIIQERSQAASYAPTRHMQFSDIVWYWEYQTQFYYSLNIITHLKLHITAIFISEKPRSKNKEWIRCDKIIK